MVIIEMRDAAYDTAFDLIEEAKHDVKKTKLTLCELEDAIYDCYEASKETKEEDEHDEDTEMGLRRSRRSNYRHDDYYGVHDEDDDDVHMHKLKRAMHHRLGMRRNRMGRFV